MKDTNSGLKSQLGFNTVTGYSKKVEKFILDSGYSLDDENGLLAAQYDYDRKFFEEDYYHY